MKRGFLTVPRWDRRAILRFWVTFVVAVGFAGLVTAAILRLLDEPEVWVGLAIPFLAALAIGMFAVPVHMLPAIVVVILAVFPTRLIPSGGPFNALPPMALLLAVWVFRRLVLDQRSQRLERFGPVTRVGPRLAVYTLAILFAAWLFIAAFLAGGGETELGWSIAFVLSALVPLLVFDAREEVALLRPVLIIVGALVGLNIFIEMLLGFSPVYGIVDVVLGASREFEFSVYRARGAFSHPLFAGAFLTIPVCLAIGGWITTGKKWMLLCGALAGAGILGTVSRGSIAAVAVAVAIALVVTPFFLGWQRITRWFALLALAAVGGLAVLNFGPLLDRADSIESRLSADVRDRALTVAIDAAQYGGWFGTGPGTSGETGRLFDSIVIENSLLQLLISVGVPGLLFFLGFMGCLVLAAWSHRDLGVGMAVIAYVVAITGFNSLDAVRSMHILIGILALLAVNDAREMARPATDVRDSFPTPTSVTAG